jgi:hypothetical protein
MHGRYPCYPPPLRVAVVALVVVIVVREHVALGHLRGVELAAAKDARRRVHHGRAGGVEAVLYGVHYGGQSRACLVVASVYFEIAASPSGITGRGVVLWYADQVRAAEVTSAWVR